MRDQGLFGVADDGDSRVLTVRLDWRSLIPVVVLVAGVWLLGKIWETVLLLVIALILAGSLAPVVAWLERRGLGRGGAIGAVLVALLAVLGALGALGEVGAV